MLTRFDRVELERRRRMRECHVADRPTAQELTRVLLTFGARAPAQRGSFEYDRPRAYVLRVALAALAGLLLTLGALAATDQLKLSAFSEAFTGNKERGSQQGGLVQPNARRARNQTTPRASEAPPPRAVASALETPENVKMPPSEPTRPTEPVQEQRDKPSAGNAPATVSPAPAPAPAPTPTPARASETAPNAAAARTSTSTSTSTPALPEALNPPHAWLRAATALRTGDRATAEAALSELSQSSDAETRDAALLARAELDASSGNAARARASLNRLAETGATAFVRRRARQILNRSQ